MAASRYLIALQIGNPIGMESVEPLTDSSPPEKHPVLDCQNGHADQAHNGATVSLLVSLNTNSKAGTNSHPRFFDAKLG